VNDSGGRTAALDKQHCWHPFTGMRDWCDPAHEPLVLVGGERAWLIDEKGGRYIDGNSSIWTNLHGHNHPRINSAIAEQLSRVAHTSFLGFTHQGAVELARRLVEIAPGHGTQRVFFSDNGSTAIEVALKMASQFRRVRGETQRTKVVAFSGAYHGDTLGAAAVGGIAVFHELASDAGMDVVRVSTIDDLPAEGSDVSAAIIEPLLQGAAGMRLWPSGTLSRLREWCDAHGVLLIADEVMTGFGRTGRMFACEHENVVPDFLALAKGLTGGYLPLAATIVSANVAAEFNGRYGDPRTFYYGHSYTANPLGCAAALASLDVFREEDVLVTLAGKIRRMSELLDSIARMRSVYEVRQCGFVAGIELRKPDRSAFPASERIGTAVCMAARKHRLLTRPIGDTIVLMPPFCITEEELGIAVEAIRAGIEEVLGGGT
jgi:adenosylmethionine-8-amino-7-oxononanoate aminotransferase